MTAPDGRHLSFPFRMGVGGRTANVTSLEDHVRDEIVQLVLTGPGERVFLPEFGGGARRLVFEAASDATAAMAKARLSQSLATYLGHRVTVEELTVSVEDAQMTIDLRYRVAGTEDSRRLLFQRSGS